MDKHELIGLTLDRLFDHFRMSPESFEYVDSKSNPSRTMNPTIIWRPKIQLTDVASTLIDDPNNNHAVIITFNAHFSEFYCYLFLSALIDINGTRADSVISSKRRFYKLRKNYRRFKELRNLIQDRDQYKENRKFLKKLSSVFPDTLDDLILKD